MLKRNSVIKFFFLRINFFLCRHFEMISMLLFKRFFFVDTCYDVLFCNTEITSSCTTSVCWDISSNALGYVTMNSSVFKVPYMFRKFCIVSTMLVAKWFCMVVVLLFKRFFWFARAVIYFFVIQRSHLLVPHLYAEA